jgi:protein gp37
MHPDWARGLRDQCQAAGVPLLFKQAGCVLAREWGGKGAGSDPAQWPEPFPRHYPQPQAGRSQP